MEAALRLSLYGAGFLLGALRQSLLASLAVSLVVRVLKKAVFSPTRPGRVSSHPPTHRLRQSFSRDAPSPDFVLASLRASTYQELYASPLRSLRPC